MKTIDYAPPATRRRRPWWLPVALLVAAATVWHRPRLTPTFFPDVWDLAALGITFAGAVAAGRCCDLPGWATTAFGGVAVGLFLLANLNDNNFRADARAGDLVGPWTLYVVAGAVVARGAAWAGGRRIARPPPAVTQPR